MKNNTLKAKELFESGGYSCVFVSEKETKTSTERGIKPLLKLLDENADMRNFSAADKIVGRAAAFLYIKLGISEIYAEVLSEKAKELLEKNDIPCFFKTLTDKVINRRGDGICPMEKAVENSTTPEDAEKAVRAEIVKLSQTPLTSNTFSDIIPKKK